MFPDRVAELEGFARPLYGIVPLTVGGGAFDHWDRVVAGLEAGTDPSSAEYWGPVASGPDQRMVEQAAIGLALAFCPERTWEPLGTSARKHLATWLNGIFELEPAPNNWQFFRVLVALGLQRVGVGFDQAKVDQSIQLLESYRKGDHWYVDGALGNVDYYIPFAFHTYGLMYAAANDQGLGDDALAEAYRERAAAFAPDFVNWFAPDGAAIPFGRSLTYRFAMASFWGALAWADVEALPWGEAKGLLLRHLRWWAQRPISDRDGVLSVGFAYDNRRVSEGYNSAGSPYWCMKAFGALAAPPDHPFWTAEEVPLPGRTEPVELPEAGWVTHRDNDQAVSLVGLPAPAFSFMEQVAAKYRKFAYSSVFGFSGDVEPAFSGNITDSMLAFTDADGNRRTRLGIEAAGVEEAMVWCTWHPWPTVRVDTVLWGGVPWHGRLHRIRTPQRLHTDETGFALGYEAEGFAGFGGSSGDLAVAAGAEGCSALIPLDTGIERTGTSRPQPVNANLLRSHTLVPVLSATLEPGDHVLGCLVFGSPTVAEVPDERPALPDVVVALLDRISTVAVEPPAAPGDLLSLLRRRTDDA